jgi:hypothetical protein
VSQLVCQDIGPGQFQEINMQRAGRPGLVGKAGPYKVVQASLTKIGAIFFDDAKGIAWRRFRIVRIEPLDHFLHQLPPQGRLRRIIGGAVGIFAEASSNQNCGAAN